MELGDELLNAIWMHEMILEAFKVFVNGKPIQYGNLVRSVTWSPKEPGFYSILAIDRVGNVAASNVELSNR